VDIGSSYAASRVVNLVKGATKSMVIDFGVLVEGKADDELPERLIGARASSGSVHAYIERSWHELQHTGPGQPNSGGKAEDELPARLEMLVIRGLRHAFASSPLSSATVLPGICSVGAAICTQPLSSNTDGCLAFR